MLVRVDNSPRMHEVMCSIPNTTTVFTHVNTHTQRGGGEGDRGKEREGRMGYSSLAARKLSAQR